MVSPTAFGQRDAWEGGSLPTVEQLAPNVWVIPVPCPFRIRYTFAYLLANNVGEFVVVDPGWDDSEARHHLTTGIQKAGFSLSSLIGVVVTHSHPDHLAMAPWLASHSGAWTAMHPVEAANARRLAAADGAAKTAAERAWLENAGAPRHVIDQLLELDRFKPGAEHQPTLEFEDEDAVRLPGRDVRVLFTPGHTAGHLCVVDIDNRLILTGDHVLPTISPNVGTGPSETDRDSISEYLTSLDAMARWADFEVLPAHQYRFTGLAGRTVELRAELSERSEEVSALMTERPHASTWDVASQVSWSCGWEDLDLHNRRLALMEATAHVRHLSAER